MAILATIHSPDFGHVAQLDWRQKLPLMGRQLSATPERAVFQLECDNLYCSQVIQSSTGSQIKSCRLEFPFVEALKCVRKHTDEDVPEYPGVAPVPDRAQSYPILEMPKRIFRAPQSA